MTLVEAREKKGLSQAELARRVGLMGTVICDFEKERRKPWPKARRDIARVLGMSERDLWPEHKGAK